MKVLDLRNVDWGNSVKAICSFLITVQTPNNQTVQITIKDVKLIEGSNGMFVASPSISYEKDGEKKYKNICDFPPTFQQMATDILAEAYEPEQEPNHIYSEKSEYKDREKEPAIPF